MATKTKVPTANKFLHLRMKETQLATFKKAAETLGLSLSAWVRSTLVAAARKAKAQ